MSGKGTEAIESKKNDVHMSVFAAIESVAQSLVRMYGATASAQRNFSVRTRFGTRRCVHSEARVMIFAPSFAKT
jgi:hypothetical protein